MSGGVLVSKDKIELSALFGLPPEKAIKFFESKGYVIGFNWHNVWQESHVKAFTVAGILKQDILTDIHQSLLEAQKAGISQKQWEKGISQTLYDKGWLGKSAVLIGDENGELQGKRLTPHRLRTIYQTNLRMAERSGEYQQLQEIKHLRPFWQYVSQHDARPSHLAMNGRVYPADDPFWDSFYPPNGWNCRCKVLSLKQRDIDNNSNLTLSYTKPEDYEVFEVELGGKIRQGKALRLANGQVFRADLGFDYNVGKSHLANLGRTMLEKGGVASAQVAAIAINHTFQNPYLMKDIVAQFAQAVAVIKGDIEQGKARPQGKFWYIGALLPQVVKALSDENISVQSAVISISDRELYHLFRTNKANREFKGEIVDKRLPEEFIIDLPRRLLNPKAVVQDLNQKKPTLLYVYDSPNGKIAIKLNYELEISRKESVQTNLVVSGERILDITSLKSAMYKLLWGEL